MKRRFASCYYLVNVISFTSPKVITGLTSYILQFSSYKLQFTSYKLQFKSYKLHFTSYKLHFTSYKLYFSRWTRQFIMNNFDICRHVNWRSLYLKFWLKETKKQKLGKQFTLMCLRCIIIRENFWFFVKIYFVRMELITHFVKNHFVKNPSSWLSLNKAMATCMLI